MRRIEPSHMHRRCRRPILCIFVTLDRTPTAAVQKAPRPASADNAKPSPHEPCSTPLMKPRERAGQDSMARAAPAGHSAPIPMPSSARKKNKNAKLGEKPAMKLQSEYQKMEIISGVFRPIRSAIQPAAVAPTKRIHNVMVNTAVTAVKDTSNSLAIGTMISRKIVKSNASSVQPSQAAIQAFHCSLLGSFHQGISKEELRAADIVCSCWLIICHLLRKKLLAAWKAARKREKTKKMN